MYYPFAPTPSYNGYAPSYVTYVSTCRHKQNTAADVKTRSSLSLAYYLLSAELKQQSRAPVTEPNRIERKKATDMRELLAGQSDGIPREYPTTRL